MKNIIIPSAAVLALIAFTKKNRNTPTKAQSIEQNATQTTAAATLPTKTIGNVENYSSMKISEWSDIYKNQYINSDPETAANYVWNLWINERNPHRGQIRNKEQLIFELATYYKKKKIGNTNTLLYSDEPIYQTWYNWFYNVPSWDCDQWKLWYQLNKQKKGQATAKNKFITAWNNPDNFSYTFSSAGNECGIDCDFVEFFRVEGIDVSYTGVETICNLSSLPSNVITAVNTTAQTANNTISTVGAVLPFLIIGGSAFFIYNQTKQIK